MAKSTVDTLAADVKKILDGFENEVTVLNRETIKKVTSKGVQSVKSASSDSFGGTGKYAKGWTSRVETGRYSAQGIIYNKDVPELPHLLEHGHAKRGGGRVPGRVHIKPVEDELEKAFIDTFGSAL